MPSERSLVIASAGVKPSPPATTRSAPALDHLLGVDRGEGRDVGQGDGLRREVAAVIGRDDPVAGTEVEQDLGRGRGERDDLLGRGRERDGRAFVIGERDGIGRRRRWAGAGRGRRDRGRAGDGCARRCRGRRGAGACGEDEDEDREERRQPAGRRGPSGRGERREHEEPPEGWDSGGVATNRKPLASTRIEGGA